MSSCSQGPGVRQLGPAVTHGRSPMVWILLSILAVFVAALVVARTRVEPRIKRAQERGRAYEDHVLAPARLPGQTQAAGGVLAQHPTILVPRIGVPARYYASPGGFEGPLLAHDQAGIAQWHACSMGAGSAPPLDPLVDRCLRIPDAIARNADGSETLYELKCPSPWLTFAAGTAWAHKMQTAFASQAVAFFAWADQAHGRSVVYGFCGWVPPWAAAVLDDLQSHFHRTIRVRASFMAAGFAPARALEGRSEGIKDEALDLLRHLAPDDLTGAAYDWLKD